MGKKGYTVYCQCGNKLFDYDGKYTMTINMKCRKCLKLAIFTPRKGKQVSLVTIPSRTSGSGKRFY